MKPAEELTGAAQMLREAAKSAHMGPWRITHYGGGERNPAKLIYNSSGPTGIVVHSPQDMWGARPHYHRDAFYVALMDPPVALALAKWLDHACQQYTQEYGEDSRIESVEIVDALHVARAVLDGAS